MERLVAFFEMGGYAAFVWPPFVIAALVMAGLAIASRRRLRASERLLAELEETARPAPQRPPQQESLQQGSSQPAEETP